MDSEPKIPILIVGATGQLGSLITKHCLLKPNLLVNILIRNPDKNKDLCSQVQKAGGKVVLGDVTQHSTLKDTTKGMHTVVSALIGDDNTVLEGQKTLLNDGIANGIKRFVPSDFSLDYTKIDEGEHVWLSLRIAFRRILAASPVKGLHIFNGGFMETLFYLYAKDLIYLTNPNQPLNITTYEDTARYVAAAVAKPNRVGDLKISGDIITAKQAAAVYNKLRGTNIETRKNASLDELKRMLDECKENKDYFKLGLLGYSLLESDGRGFYSKTDNMEFPEIKPITFEEYLKRNPNATLKYV